MDNEMDGQSLAKQVDWLLSIKKSDEAERLLAENREIVNHNNLLLQIYYLIPICTQEREAGQATLFSKVSGIEELLERGTKVKFYVRRIGFDLLEDEDEFCSFCAQNKVSLPELMIHTYLHSVHTEKVLAFIQRKIREGRLQA